MAKRKKALPARKRRDRSRDDDSLLLRSAESLGRVIGALQRELDKAAARLMKPDGAIDREPSPKRAIRAQRKAKGASAASRATKAASSKKAAPRTRKGGKRTSRQ